MVCGKIFFSSKLAKERERKRERRKKNYIILSNVEERLTTWDDTTRRRRRIYPARYNLMYLMIRGESGRNVSGIPRSSYF